MLDKEAHLYFLRAFGGVPRGGISGQLEALYELQQRTKALIVELQNKRRVELAQETANRRIPRGDPQWGTHMTHCYGLDYDSVYGHETPTERHRCKYGDDDICPAALYEDPWEEWTRQDIGKD